MYFVIVSIAQGGLDCEKKIKNIFTYTDGPVSIININYGHFIARDVMGAIILFTRSENNI